jgi:hypothetical protein
MIQASIYSLMHRTTSVLLLTFIQVFLLHENDCDRVRVHVRHPSISLHVHDHGSLFFQHGHVRDHDLLQNHIERNRHRTPL